MSRESSSVLATMRRTFDLGATQMKYATCKHCCREIGAWEDMELQNGRYMPVVKWMHAPDDGPDAYQECSDGEIAEPSEFGRDHLCANCCKVGRVKAWEDHGNFTDVCPVDAGEKRTKFSPLHCGYVSPESSKGACDGGFECTEPAIVMLDEDSPRCKKHGKEYI